MTIMPPVEYHSHPSGHDRVQARLWRPHRLDDRGTGRLVKSRVELDPQGGALVQRERAEEAPFENWEIHLKRVQLHESAIDRQYARSWNENRVVRAVVIETQADLTPEHKLEAADGRRADPAGGLSDRS